MCKKKVYSISIVFVLSLAVPAFGQQLTLNNADFDAQVLGDGAWDGTPTGWTGTLADSQNLSAGQGLSPPSQSGQNICAMNEDGSLSQIPQYGGINETVQPNKTYKISVWVGRRAGDEGMYGGILEVYLQESSTSTRIAQTTYDLENQPKNSWTYQAFYLITGASPTGVGSSLQLGLMNNSDRPGQFWHKQVILDDVSIIDCGPIAINPSPADESVVTTTSVSLQWQPGPFAAQHDIYFTDNRDDVNSAGSDDPMGPGKVYKARQSVDANSYTVTDLTPGTTYYWRIDEVSGPPDYTVYKGDIWSFTVQSEKSYNPSPPDDAVYVDIDADLAWNPGVKAQSHDVYFGTTDPPPFKVNQTATTYAFPTLEYDTLYYWRIDERNTDASVTTGDVWSFTTVPFIPITDPNLVGWWKLDDGRSMALDWSTRDNHGTLYGDPIWVAGILDGALEFSGVEYVDFGNAESLNITGQITLAVWVNTNDAGNGEDNPYIAKGNTSYSLRHSANNSTGFFIYDGAENYSAASPVSSSFNGIWHHVAGTYDGSNLKLYVDGDLKQTIPYAGPIATNTFGVNVGRDAEQTWMWYNGVIDDVRIYNRALTQEEIKLVMRGDPLLAWNPKPAIGRVMDLIDAETELPLSWSPGDEALHHNVYFGTDYAAVDAADASDTTGIYRGQQDANNYTPPEGVERGQTYYWRIDEINPDATISEGRIWSFTIADYLIVDDFEDYNNNSPDKVFQTWIDGLGYTQPPPGVPGNGTGSIVGHDIVSPDSPYFQGNILETLIVHVSGKSMPMDYNNVNDPYVSEAIRTWDTPQDWTAEGVAALTIWFRGYRQSVGGITYNAATQTYTMTGAGADIYGESDEFHYAYKQLSGEGSITAKVENLTDIHEWSKAGVMIRETLDADSAQVLISVTPQNGVEFMYRLAGETTTAWAEAGYNAPHWVRIRRVQNDFFAEHSTDNVTWVDVQGDNPSSANIPMSVNTYIGLHLCSHEEFQTAEAVFSNVRIIGDVTPTGPFTQSQDIGILSNDADRFYVILEDDDDNSHLVEYPEPNATQIYEWQDFNIDMREFTNAGVNTAAITKMTLGVGNKAAPASAGTGSMYFDDIRLHWPRCVPSQLQPVGDLNDDCVVNYSDIDEMAGEWLSIPAPGAELIADLDDDGDVDFGDYAELASTWLEERIWPVL